VGDQDDRHAEPLAQVVDELQDLLLDGDIQRGRRLVGDQQLRLAGQPVAGGLVQSQPGLRPPGTWDPFEAGVAVIAGGPYSPEQAAAILGQIARRHGTPVPGLSQLGLDRMFPGPGVLAAAGLDGLGLDASRITAVRAYARAAARSKVQPDRADDVDEFLDAAEQAAGSWRPWRAHAGAHL
jgi:3-methyladenine DNA glycosylase/8-oxoguanine DNA glycosylase